MEVCAVTTEPVRANSPDDPRGVDAPRPVAARPAESAAADVAARDDRAHAWSGSFYGWLWRRLPGSRLVRVVTLVVLAAIIVVLLFLVVFPWVEPRLPFNQVTVGGNGG
jgi:hypothetical protein